MFHLYSTYSSKHGFTLIEFFVGVTILIIVGASLFFVLNNQSIGQLQSDAEIISSRLSDSQSRAIAGVNGNAWGIRFDNTNSSSPFYTLFEGASYTTSTNTYYLSSTIEFQTPTGGATVNVAFAKLTGKISATSTIVIRLKSNPTNTKTITITPSGEISVSQ